MDAHIFGCFGPATALQRAVICWFDVLCGPLTRYGLICVSAAFVSVVYGVADRVPQMFAEDLEPLMSIHMKI